MKLLRTLLLWLAVFSVQPAFAQAWGPDGEQTPTYPAIPTTTELNALTARTLPVVGDGTNAWGGDTAVVQPSGISNPAVFTDGIHPTSGNTTGTDEEKFRTVCEIGFVGKFDPIRNFGVEPAGHTHMFYGNGGTNKSSTYTTLRNETALATCPGLLLNNSAYWMPTVDKPNAMGDGVRRGKKPNNVLLYYVAMEAMAYENEYDFFPRGMKHISGWWMDGANNTSGVPSYVVTEVAAANATNNYSGWQAKDQRVKWICNDTGVQARFIKSSAGVDGFVNGSFPAGCPSTSKISAEVTGPTCWDNKNLTSPGGYKQMRYALREANNDVTDVCPTGWKKFPTIVVKPEFSHQGPSDYMTWECSSDVAAAAAAGRAIGSCESFHVDWMNGWDERASDLWQAECIGARGGTYWGACNDSSISATGPRGLLKTGLNTSHNYTGALLSDWFTLPYQDAPRGRLKLRRGF